MSKRTILELNHDFGYKIKKDPEHFFELLHCLINSGSDSEDLQHEFERYGIVLTPTVDNSVKRNVTIGKTKIEF